MDSYKKGQSIRVTVTFKDFSQANADPTTVYAKATSPSNVTTQLTVTKDSTGVYHFDITLNESGIWFWQITGSGAVVAANEGSLSVDPSRF